MIMYQMLNAQSTSSMRLHAVLVTAETVRVERRMQVKSFVVVVWVGATYRTLQSK